MVAGHGADGITSAASGTMASTGSTRSTVWASWLSLATPNTTGTKVRSQTRGL